MSDEIHPAVGLFIGVMAVAASLYGLYCTWIAFFGGTIQPLGWELEGSVSTGLLWFFILTPLIATVVYWMTMLIAMPLAAVFRSE